VGEGLEVAARILEYPDDGPKRPTSLRKAPLPLRTKLMASLAAVAAAGSLMSFALVGSFDNAHDPFPHSVQAPAGAPAR
jgi:hypothetical protein